MGSPSPSPGDHGRAAFLLTLPSSRLGMAAVAGACGGFVGTPGDMTNVRMQNDMKLPPDQRRKSVEYSLWHIDRSQLIVYMPATSTR